MNSAIIIDNGTESLKIGHAGEEAPREIVKTVIGYSRCPEIEIAIEKLDYQIGEKAIKNRGLLELKYPIKERRIVDFEQMEKIWHYSFYEKAQIDPGQYACLLTESPEYTNKDRESIGEIFFESLRIRSLYLGNQGVLALYSTGFTKGIVLDSGEGGSHVTPVYEGYVSPYSVGKSRVSGSTITQYLHRLLSEKGLTFSYIKDFQIIKDIKETKCFASLNFEQECKEFYDKARLRDISYELPDNQKIILNKEVIEATEALFNPNLIGFSEVGISELIYKSYFAIDTEIHNSLFENIVICGGNTLIPNVPERICKDIKTMEGNSINFKIITQAERKYSSWIGGSVLACLPPFESMWITSKEYEEFGSSIMNDKRI